jgi:hypothetical protein
VTSPCKYLISRSPIGSDRSSAEQWVNAHSDHEADVVDEATPAQSLCEYPEAVAPSFASFYISQSAVHFDREPVQACPFILNDLHSGFRRVRECRFNPREGSTHGLIRPPMANGQRSGYSGLQRYGLDLRTARKARQTPKKSCSNSA